MREHTPLAVIAHSESRPRWHSVRAGKSECKTSFLTKATDKSCCGAQFFCEMPGEPRETVTIPTEASTSTLWIEGECAAVVVVFLFVGFQSFHLHIHCFTLAQEKKSSLPSFHIFIIHFSKFSCCLMFLFSFSFSFSYSAHLELSKNVIIFSFFFSCRSGSWPFFSWAWAWLFLLPPRFFPCWVVVWPFLLGVWVWPFLLGVGVGPSFSGLDVGLRVGVGTSFSLLRVDPSLRGGGEGQARPKREGKGQHSQKRRVIITLVVTKIY